MSLIPASAAAPPTPLELIAVPGPLMSAVALPLANASVELIRSAAFTEPSELASIRAEAEANPSKAEAAERLMLASETAEAVPSPPVLTFEPVASTLAIPFITLSSVVETSTSPAAVDVADVELSFDVVEDAPSAKALPLAKPLPFDEPSKLTKDVV